MCLTPQNEHVQIHNTQSSSSTVRGSFLLHSLHNNQKLCPFTCLGIGVIYFLSFTKYTYSTQHQILLATLQVCVKFYHFAMWLPWLQQHHFFTDCSAGLLTDLSPWSRLSLVPGLIQQVLFYPCSVLFFFLVWIWYVDFIIASYQKVNSTEN